MIDLHTHTFFSDGVLSPSELVYRAKLAGYTAIAITDHADESSFEQAIKNVLKAKKNLTKHYDIKVFAGCELTYVPPALIKLLTIKARKLGADVIVCHGETTAENVPPGTNRAAILAKVDILAHPGKISDEDVELAAKNNVALEITSRRGHRNTNNYVYKLAKKHGAKLVFGNDTHQPEDILNKDQIMKLFVSSKIPKIKFDIMIQNAEEILKTWRQ
ncbi:histidinol phosphate phosphatase domain-containing protein [bacterium]